MGEAFKKALAPIVVSLIFGWTSKPALDDRSKEVHCSSLCEMLPGYSLLFTPYYLGSSVLPQILIKILYHDCLGLSSFKYYGHQRSNSKV